MDLKHLEDFVSLCDTRSFSRSAIARNVTQSAFSRRIQALELWLGVALIDRSTYPTSLTHEGRLFRETADEVLNMLQDARSDMQARRGLSRRTISFAALHTLALSVFPEWLKDIERTLGPLKTDVLADNSHNCIQSLVEGKSDFLLTFHHDAVPLSIDPERFPFIVLGEDRLLAASRCENGRPMFALDGEASLLAYGADSFLGRMSAYAARIANVQLMTSHVNDNAVAEILKAMVVAGHGIAWLPESLIRRDLASGLLCDLGADVRMQIRMYRSAERTRHSVNQFWEAACALPAMGVS
ncbi:LysR family transcriptional regulator [Sphingomonas psychrotolerans]|uniref:LysR family transcriptional regulator n=1 Tax=Sphingomonas psychrotolerans TaxID=1327635 RepID=A0A2K8MRW9_9SPHN|nr:LysR family transcriptional regulator [Sphingomonas psychrotolerans]ATY34779.1 LysR family transcriptional regulator [Sphingomonas psychrotolerans]